MEFAIIETGGKQYSVKKGALISIPKITKETGSHKEGDKIVFDKVLLHENNKDTTIGNPYIKGATINGTITKIGREEKIIVTHYKSKSRYWKRNGHRQDFFEVRIDSL